MAYKQKTFSGFGNSPFKQGEQTPWDPNSGISKEEHKRKETEAMKRALENREKRTQNKTYPPSYTKEDIKFLEEQREDIVRYEELDEMGKKIWNCNRNPKTRWNNKTKKCETIKKD